MLCGGFPGSCVTSGDFTGEAGVPVSSSSVGVSTANDEYDDGFRRALKPPSEFDKNSTCGNAMPDAVAPRQNSKSIDGIR